jgi:tetratricopeptide (TPR) repeat protein
MLDLYNGQLVPIQKSDGMRFFSRQARLRAFCFLLVAIAPLNLWPQASSNLPATPSVEDKNVYLEGIELAKKGKLDEAIATFEKALEINRQNPVLLDATGAAYSLKGDSDRARQYFLESLEVDAKFVPARKNLAIIYFDTGQYDLATKEFQELKNISPVSQSVANLFLGMIAEKNGDYVGAASLLEQSGTLLNQYPEALLSFASCEIQLKHLHEAKVALTGVENIAGLTGAQYLKAAELNSRLGQNAQALADLDKAHAKDNQLEHLSYQRAVVLDQMNRPQEALAILKELTATSPDGESLNLLAHVAQRTGDFGLAMKSLRQAAKLDPSREDNYLDFSTICADYGNYPLALEAANVGLDHLPDSYNLMVQKGVVLENLGRLDEAQEVLRTASKLQKDNSVALLSLAIVQTHGGQLEEAEGTLTEGIADFPDNYYMHYHLGKVLVQLQEAHPDDPGLAAKARKAFQQAIHLNPSYADSYFQLAKMNLKDAPKVAEEELNMCLRLDPNYLPAEYTLARLYLSTGRRAAGQALIDRFESQQQAEKFKEQQKPRIESAQK